MMRRLIGSVLLMAVLAECNAANAQATKQNVVDERNVRAAMNFLAGDAMQGRGSGTQFERIAAEYIGSQFMQFGLEPAGETGPDGRPTYVQTVNISRRTFAEAPVLKIGAISLLHGKEMIVLRTNTETASGGLQKLSAGATPKAGAVVLITSNAGADQRSAMAAAQAMAGAGAGIVIFEETEQVRSNWSNFAARMPTFTTSQNRPAVVVVVDKATFASLSSSLDGTKIEFGGKLAPAREQNTWNAVGKITGSDKAQAAEVILLSSHLDHLGVRESAPGTDKIFNGADDDASGSVAVLEIARVLVSGKRPKRTVYFVCFGSEEAGGFGSSYFVNNLPFPKEKLIANLQFEMIGRPDPKVKPDELWLTGYDRSDLGPELAKHGAKLVADPHPEENFFQRSDNYTLARQGIVAHTVSSFGLHNDYHRASDEISTINFPHMTRSINSMIGSIQWLVNSTFIPTWNEGRKP